ncbi:hypothetical protein AX17_002265 [Amanita inopinata Kibby_2008]|nr:hypothetical protein AX17_002265 [Amanita inopinata Kibby_2008]
MNQEPHLQYLSSGISELDSLSDSDWLDIASSRESDDNDSVASDRDEMPSVPLSRRSSASFGSSREGDVEAWEGFVEDSSDEGGPRFGPGFSLDLDPPRETAEDQRVKEGLEQSLISTLSASRASSGAPSASAHASLRDLRLSFPDPLTSSKNDLTQPRSDTPPVEFVSVTNHFEPLEASTSTPGLEPGTTTSALASLEARPLSDDINVDFEIVLYGTSSTSKWSMTEELIRKAASFSHLDSFSSEPSAGMKYFYLEPRLEIAANQFNTIAVHDCTEGASHLEPGNAGKPSLAVVYLPSPALAALPEHSFYLPIVLQHGLLDKVSDAGVYSAAESAWKLLSIPASKTLRLGDYPGPWMLSEGDIQALEPIRVYRALQRVHTKKQTVKAFSDHLTSVHAVTFFALVSIVMSFAMNTVFRPPEPTPVAMTRMDATSRSWVVSNAEMNKTVVPTPTPMSQHAGALITSSLKDFALAVINPTSTSLSLTSQVPLFLASEPVSAKPITRAETQPPLRPAKTAPSTDIILRTVPVTSLSHVLTKPSTSIVSVAGKLSHAIPTSSALSIRLVDSLSEVLETTVKAVIEVVQNDLKELIDAMDDLMRAIHEQTKKAMAKSTDKAYMIREHMKHRNDRARDKARAIKQRGEQLLHSASEQVAETTYSMKSRGEKFMLYASEHIRDRTTVAKKRAHKFRERMVRSEAWKTYVGAHGEWVKKMKGKHVRMEHKRMSKGYPVKSRRAERCRKEKERVF